MLWELPISNGDLINFTEPKRKTKQHEQHELMRNATNVKVIANEMRNGARILNENTEVEQIACGLFL